MVSWLDRNSRMGSCTSYGSPPKRLELLPTKGVSSYSNLNGPTTSYIKRPLHPYDLPRRKRSPEGPQRAASKRKPVTALPPLPTLSPLSTPVPLLTLRSPPKREAGLNSVSRFSPMPGTRSSRDCLPNPPPSTRRQSKDPQEVREREKRRFTSCTDQWAALG